MNVVSRVFYIVFAEDAPLSGYRTGYLLGTFDPVSLAHTESCLSSLRELGLDRVLLVLSGASAGTPRRDRWRMLVAACAGSSDLVPVKLKRGEGSAALRALFPGDKLIPLSPPFSAGKELCPSVQEYCDLLDLYGARRPRIDDAESRIRLLFKALNPHRFAHSLSVARTAAQLAAAFGADAAKAEEAGLFHDCAKCLPLPEMQEIARENHLTDEPEVLASPALLHSIVGAVLARRDYGITDPDMLSAIAYHNTGCPGMSPLAMCVCLADFIEPNREPFPGLEETRHLAGSSLEKALLFSLESTADHVRSRGYPLYPRTLDTIAWLRALPAVSVK